MTLRLFPDEIRYRTMATGQRVARPFALRWLLPAVCRTNRTAWLTVQIVSFLALAGLVGVETGKWWAGLLLLGCSGLTLNLKHPFLVDLPALALAYGSAVAWTHGLWWIALGLILIAGCVKESAPVFGAAFCLSPWLLIGLLPVGCRWLMRSGPDVLDAKNAWILEHPFRASWEFHRPLPPAVYVLPWGVLLLGLVHPTAAVLVPLGLAMGSLLVATDTVRLYQWAAPALIVATVPIIGPWVIPAVLLHLTNPFASEGF